MSSVDSMQHSGIEAENDGEHIVGEAAGQRSERMDAAGRLHGALRLEIEAEDARASEKREIAHGSIAMNEESDLRVHRRILGRLEAHGDLANDVVQVPLIWELDPVRVHGRHIRPAVTSRTAARLRRRLLRLALHRLL